MAILSTKIKLSVLLWRCDLKIFKMATMVGGRPSWISDWIDLSHSECQCHHFASHQFSAQSDTVDDDCLIKGFQGHYGCHLKHGDNYEVAPTLPPRDCSIPLTVWEQMWWMTSKMAVKATIFYIRKKLLKQHCLMSETSLCSIWFTVWEMSFEEQ